MPRLVRVRGAVAVGLVGWALLAPDPGVRAQSFVFDLLEQYLESLRAQAGIPGLSAAVVQDGRIVWERGFGVRDLESAQPAEPDTLYPVGDLTQTLAATVLLQCVERGRLALDDPMRIWTTRIPEDGASVRHVLAHISGDPPGRRFRYDPERFVSLTAVIEACADRPYRVAIADEILDRLGMRDSVPGHDLRDAGSALRDLFDEDALERYAEVLERQATPYRVDQRGRVSEGDYPETGMDASTGLVSTVRDLARFDAALDDRVLLDGDTLELAWSNQASTDGPALPTGLGWFLQSHDGERVVWHFGQWSGAYSSLIVKLPGRGVTMILLANSDGLTAPFAMQEGDVTASLFARVFLGLFI